MLSLHTRFLCLYITAVDLSSCAGGTRGPAGSGTQAREQLVLLGCRHCAQNLGPQLGANLKQTRF